MKINKFFVDYINIVGASQKKRKSGPGIIAADTADRGGIKLDPMTRQSIDSVAEKLLFIFYK